jgi:hypothetical protein
MTLKQLSVKILSLLGAAGTALQSYMAVAGFIQGLLHVAFAASRAGIGLTHGLAAVLGGFCTGIINFSINTELLDSFIHRILHKPSPELSGWQKFRYWLGCGVFILTGILFGLTAIAFGPTGPLAIVSLTAGIFVAIIMMVQELETWLESFDNPDNLPKKSLKELFYEWKNSLNNGKLLGFVISIGNVVALSLLFTVGLCTFFTGMGVAALPAVAISFGLAYTCGAFTEFYFYNRFLSAYCDKFSDNWKKLMEGPYPYLGIACAATNAVVNGILAYVGVMMIISLLAAASLAVPPLTVMIGIAATLAVFAGAASGILGMNFWLKKSVDLKKYMNNTDTLLSPSTSDTTSVLRIISTESTPAQTFTAYTPSYTKIFTPGTSPKNDKKVAEEQKSEEAQVTHFVMAQTGH